MLHGSPYWAVVASFALDERAIALLFPPRSSITKQASQGVGEEARAAGAHLTPSQLALWLLRS